MSHLIQAVSVPTSAGFELLCIKHGATTPKWRTVSILSSTISLVGAENGDAWVGLGTYGFATSCFRKFTITFTPDPIDEEYEYFISINGSTQAQGQGTGVLTEEIDLNILGLMGRACGNIFSIGLISIGEIVDVTAEITNVTFGPP